LGLGGANAPPKKNVKTMILSSFSPYMHPLWHMYMHPQGKSTPSNSL